MLGTLRYTCVCVPISKILDANACTATPFRRVRDCKHHPLNLFLSQPRQLKGHSKYLRNRPWPHSPLLVRLFSGGNRVWSLKVSGKFDLTVHIHSTLLEVASTPIHDNSNRKPPPKHLYCNLANIEEIILLDYLSCGCCRRYLKRRYNKPSLYALIELWLRFNY